MNVVFVERGNMADGQIKRLEEFGECIVIQVFDVSKIKTVPESLRVLPSEAVYMFAAWLSTREKTLTVGERYECSGLAELVNQFCKANNLEPTRDDVYPHNLRHPT